jgi:hypothetical protein
MAVKGGLFVNTSKEQIVDDDGYEEGKDKSAKGSDDKGKASPSDKSKSTKPSDDKGKSTNKETKKK